MKRVQKLVATVMMFSLLFAACSKSADPVAAAPTLVGTWTQTTAGITGCTGTLAILNITTPCTSGCTATITATTISTSAGSSTYTTSGSTLTITNGPQAGTYTYVVTATTLVVTLDASTLIGPGCKSVLNFTRVS